MNESGRQHTLTEWADEIRKVISDAEDDGCTFDFDERSGSWLTRVGEIGELIK